MPDGRDSTMATTSLLGTLKNGVRFEGQEPGTYALQYLVFLPGR